MHSHRLNQMLAKLLEPSRSQHTARDRIAFKLAFVNGLFGRVQFLYPRRVKRFATKSIPFL